MAVTTRCTVPVVEHLADPVAVVGDVLAHVPELLREAREDGRDAAPSPVSSMLRFPD